MSASSSVSYAPAQRPAAEAGGRGFVDRLIHTRPSTAAMVARVTLGAVIFPHAAQKAFGWFGGHGFSATMQGFQGMGMPAIIAALAILAELIGSIGLILGVLSRLSALAIAGVMIGAIFLVHLPYGFWMNWAGTQAGEGFEFHLLAFGLATAVLLAGGGRWSVDRAISKKVD